MADGENVTKYELNEMTEITQYNVEDVYKDGSETEKAFGNPKTYIPVFHGLQPKPGEGGEPIKIELYEGYVEIGGPTLEPWDTEEYDDEILAQSGLEKDIHPDSISVSPIEATVTLAYPLVTKTITAVVKPTSSEFPINWSAKPSGKVDIIPTDDPSVVTIKPLAVSDSVAVMATSGAVNATANITVTKIDIASVTLNESSATLAPGDTLELTADISPDNAYGYDEGVAWSSSNEAIATVEGGVVTAVANGNATITATSVADNTKTATCTIAVVTPVTGVELDESSITLTVGGTQQLTATISPETASDTAVIWSSNDETIATVEDGLVTALAEGNATITVTSHADGTITDNCSVTITQGE